MPINRIIKIACLNIGIAIINTIIFSPGFLGLQIAGSNALATAFGVTVILMSIVIFVFGNFMLINTKEIIIKPSQIKSMEDYIVALNLNYSKKTFEKDITTILAQIERVNRKKETIRIILLQKFSQSELSYNKFEETILAIQEVFYLNIRSILNKLNAFDEADYNLVKRSGKISEEMKKMKMHIFDEYIHFVINAVEDNEEIIFKLDKLLFEISKLNSLEDGQIEQMSIMSEIDELINQTKYYKAHINAEGDGRI